MAEHEWGSLRLFLHVYVPIFLFEANHLHLKYRVSICGNCLTSGIVNGIHYKKCMFSLRKYSFISNGINLSIKVSCINIYLLILVSFKTP